MNTRCRKALKSMNEKALVLPKKSAEEVLNTIFVPMNQIKLLSSVKRAYANADATMHDSNSAAKWLSEGRGDFALESRIKQIAVETELCRMIEAGQLSFDYEFRRNKQGNHKYLVIKNESFHMIINQCTNDHHPAKKAKYRESENTNFQTSLDLSDSIRNFIDEPVNDEYFELNHGFKSIEPKFVCLGIPKRGCNAWEYKIDLNNSNVLLKSTDFKTKVGHVKPVTPDEFAAYQKRESND